jgi:hypothetical protein
MGELPIRAVQISQGALIYMLVLWALQVCFSLQQNQVAGYSVPVVQ